MKVEQSTVATTVQNAFSDAQRSMATHSRASKLLQSAYVSCKNSLFLEEFIHVLNRVLVILSRDAPVERVVQFIAAFTASLAELDDRFPTAILKYLTTQQNVKSAAVRFRCVQLTALILQRLPLNFEMGDVVDSVLQTALDRSQDKIPRVRTAAAMALCRLQESGDPDSDPCTSVLLKMLSTDKSPTVRKAALQAIALTPNVLPTVLRRSRDISADVRRAFYDTIAQKVSIAALEPTQRLGLLREGLRDRVKIVRDTCRDNLLLKAWMQRSCDGNIFQLVEHLECDCENNETDILRVLKLVFQSPQYNSLIQSCEIDVNELTKGDVLILRGLAEAGKGDGGIDRFIRTALEYANILKYYSVEEEASHHLLELSKSVDISDEAGRKELENVLRSNFLADRDVGDTTIGPAVRAIRRVVGEETDTARLILEIVSEDILTNSEQQISDEVEIVEVTSTEQREWQENRTLRICVESLRIFQQTESSSSPLNTILCNLLKVGVLPFLFAEDVERQRVVLECVGLFSLLDKSGETARTYFPLFMRGLESDVLEIQEVAMKTLVDMLLVFDLTKIDSPSLSYLKAAESRTENSQGNPEDSQDTPHDKQQNLAESSSPHMEISILVQKFFHVIQEYLTHGDSTMRTLATQGLARLLYIRRIAPDTEILSRLFVVHHNPSTENDHELRQFLSVFFPSFAAQSDTNKLFIEDAFFKTCDVFLDAPKTNKLSTVPVLLVAEFLLHLTSQPINSAPSSESIGRPVEFIHERLAESALMKLLEVIESDDSDKIRAYVRILLKIEMRWSEDTDVIFQVCRKLAKKCQELIDERTVKRALTSWIVHIDEIRTAAEDQADEDEEEGEDVEDDQRNSREDK